MREEYRRWGRKFHGIDEKVIEKEEKEYEAADIITVPSNFVRSTFINSGIPEEKLVTIPYGVDLQHFSKVGEPPRNRFNVLFVGQVGFRKGVPDLLEAFRQFRHPFKKLYIVGAIQSEMVRYFKLHPPEDDIEIVGHVPQTRLKDIMSKCHVMVLPSVEEGLALVQAQAMACGCPVIGTSHTGAEDIFKDEVEGFIVEPRQPSKIADRLQLLADEPSRRVNMGGAALRRVESIGGWDAYGSTMASVIQNLLQRKEQNQSRKIDIN